jgi:hypothetical protein
VAFKLNPERDRIWHPAEAERELRRRGYGSGYPRRLPRPRSGVRRRFRGCQPPYFYPTLSLPCRPQTKAPGRSARASA